MERYVVIDKTSGRVINAVRWDGRSAWTPPDNAFSVESATLQINDIVDLVTLVKIGVAPSNDEPRIAP